jgi:tetratricopeptide (TPR) repeat protein
MERDDEETAEGVVSGESAEVASSSSEDEGLADAMVSDETIVLDRDMIEDAKGADTDESGETVTGEDVTSRLDEIFGESDVLDDLDEALSPAIPEEEAAEEQPASDFYTVSGRAASEETGPEEIVPEEADDAAPPPVDEEATASPHSEEQGIDEEVVSSSDVGQRLEEMFSDDEEEVVPPEEPEELVLEGEDESDSLPEELYSVTGDEAVVDKDSEQPARARDAEQPGAREEESFVDAATEDTSPPTAPVEKPVDHEPAPEEQAFSELDIPSMEESLEDAEEILDSIPDDEPETTEIGEDFYTVTGGAAVADDGDELSAETQAGAELESSPGEDRRSSDDESAGGPEEEAEALAIVPEAESVEAPGSEEEGERDEEQVTGEAVETKPEDDTFGEPPVGLEEESGETGVADEALPAETIEKPGVAEEEPAERSMVFDEVPSLVEPGEEPVEPEDAPAERAVEETAATEHAPPSEPAHEPGVAEEASTEEAVAQPPSAGESTPSSVEETGDQAVHEEPVSEPVGGMAAIPDHVLTPTLADIYFQQGQPQVALEIYRRILNGDPDNERIARRMEEIRASMEGETPSPSSQPAPASPPPSSTPAKQAKKSKRRTSRSSRDDRPLKGVRIKKKVRERIGRKRKKR